MTAPIFLPYHNRVALKTRKADLLEHLSRPAEALNYYLKELARRADVTAAERHLQDLITEQRRYHQMDWDPGGSTNNPDRVSRALQRAASMPKEIEAAEHAIKAAQELSAQLATTPFDVDNWRSSYLA